MNLSDRNTITDLVKHGIPITKGIYHNPNFTYQDLLSLKIHAKDKTALSINKMTQPVLQNFYRKLYGKIVEELKF